jgi:hypothetical protein
MSLLVEVKIKILQILSRALLIVLLDQKRLDEKRNQQQEQYRKKIPRTAQDRYPVRPGFAPPEPSANRGGKVVLNQFYVGIMGTAPSQQYYVLTGDKSKGWDLGMPFLTPGNANLGPATGTFPLTGNPSGTLVVESSGSIWGRTSIIILPVGEDRAVVSVRHQRKGGLWKYGFGSIATITGSGTFVIGPFDTPPLPSGCGSGPKLAEYDVIRYFPWTSFTVGPHPGNFLLTKVSEFAILNQQSWLVSRTKVKHIATPSEIEAILIEMNPEINIDSTVSGWYISSYTPGYGLGSPYAVDVIAQPCGLLETKSMRQDAIGPVSLYANYGNTGWTPPTPRPSSLLPRYEKCRNFGLLDGYQQCVTPGIYTVLSDPTACDGLSTFEEGGAVLQAAGAPIPRKWALSIPESLPAGGFDFRAWVSPPSTPLPPPYPGAYRVQSAPVTRSIDFPHPNFCTWDWNRPGYCRAQALAMGFTADDLVFAADP